ncbi:MAG: radical SAM protein [Ruminococcaceae bacterium]|nr:radical SAM protein [Oscillospiraceae bacterium]
MKNLCKACPRRCNSKRTATENDGGFCKMPLFPVVARASLHFGEEPYISGTCGSGTIFFSGCSLKCVYCQNEPISHNGFGKAITPYRLAEIFAELENKGAHNINLVNPTHFIYSIKEALKIYKPKIPLVYNSSGYDLPEVIDEDIFDIYLMDLKYIDRDKSEKYSCAKDYFDFAEKSIISAYKKVGKAQFDENMIMKRGLIVRHLVLPKATNQAKDIVDWFKENVPDAYFSLMAQYTPMPKCVKFPEINRRITQREYDKVVSYVIEKDIENVYIQSLDSATPNYIPDFNLSGV